MAIFNIIGGAPQSDGVKRFKVQGYPTGRTSCCVETRCTADRAEAERWAADLNVGIDPIGAQVAMYADD